MVETSVAEHAVLEKSQLSEEHLGHLSQRGGSVRLGEWVLRQQG